MTLKDIIKKYSKLLRETFSYNEAPTTQEVFKGLGKKAKGNAQSPAEFDKALQDNAFMKHMKAKVKSFGPDDSFLKDLKRDLRAVDTESLDFVLASIKEIIENADDKLVWNSFVKAIFVKDYLTYSQFTNSSTDERSHILLKYRTFMDVEKRGDEHVKVLGGLQISQNANRMKFEGVVQDAIRLFNLKSYVSPSDVLKGVRIKH